MFHYPVRLPAMFSSPQATSSGSGGEVGGLLQCLSMYSAHHPSIYPPLSCFVFNILLHNISFPHWTKTELIIKNMTLKFGDLFSLLDSLSFFHFLSALSDWRLMKARDSLHSTFSIYGLATPLSILCCVNFSGMKSSKMNNPNGNQMKCNGNC